MTVGERISNRRKELGITQEELAFRVGYKTKSSINKIELGINDTTPSKLVKIADALFTTPAYLMGWEDEKENSPDERQLTEGEKALLDLFEKVPEDKQAMVIEMIRAALGSQK